MMLNREGFWVGELERECTLCGDLFEHNGMSMCNKCNTKRVKGRPLVSKMLSRARTRAKSKGLPFDIDSSDIFIPEKCPILGIPLVSHKGKSGAFSNSPSLDRIVPELGYTKGNVQVISQKANQMKTCSSKEDLLAFAYWVLETYGDENEDY